MDDREIMAALAARDERALAALDAGCGRLCRAIARGILGSDEDAEECVNDAWLRVWESIPPAEPPSLTAYAGMITRRIAISRWRARNADRRRAALTPIDELDELLPGGDEVSARLETAELTAAVNAFLDTLDRDTRVIFVRRYWHLEPIEAIAARMGLRAGTVRVRLHRVRRKLKEDLERRNLL